MERVGPGRDHEIKVRSIRFDCDDDDDIDDWNELFLGHKEQADE